MSHFLLMVIYSLAAACFFGLLLKEDWKDVAKVAGIIFLSLVAGSIAFAWIMYPFPG